MQTAYIITGELIDNSMIKLREPLPFKNQEIKVIIEINGEPKHKRSEIFGKYKGKIWISPDFNEPLDDFKEYME